MAYDFFTPIQSPVTPINLYAEAATAGTNVGNALPTPTTSIIQGAIQGYGQGQQIVSNQQKITAQEQENTIRQNQIDRLQQTNAAQDLAYQNDQLVAEQNKLKLQRQQMLQQDDINAGRAQLQVDTTKNNQLNALINKKQTFQNEFSAADPLKQKQMLQDGSNNDIFAAFPEVYSQNLMTVVPYMSQQELDAATLTMTKNRISKDQQAKAEKAAELIRNDNVAMENDYYLKQAANNAGLALEDVPGRVAAVPSGTYDSEPDGTLKVDPATGKFAKGPGADPKSNTWDLIYGNKVVAANVPKESHKLMIDYQQHMADIDGTNLKRRMAAAGITSNQQQSPSGRTALQPDAAEQAETDSIFAPEPAKPEFAPEPSSSVKGFKGEAKLGEEPRPIEPKPTPDIAAVEEAKVVPTRTKSGQINLAVGNQKAYDTVQRALGLPSPAYSEVKPKVKQLFQAIQSPKGAFGRYEPEQMDLVDRSTWEIAKYSAAHEYESDLVIRNSVTQEAVDQHNRWARDYAAAFNSSASSIDLEKWQGSLRESMLGFSSSNITPEMLQTVDSPKELYILQRSSFYANVVTKLRNAFEENIRNTKRSLALQNTRSAMSMQALGVK